MNYLVMTLIGVWICGVLFLVARHLNDTRMVLNNLLPGASRSEASAPQSTWPRASLSILLDGSLLRGFVLTMLMVLIGRAFNFDNSKSYRITKIDPSCLTETGKAYLGRAVRHERIMLAWIVGGFLLVAVVSYLKLSG